uniref:Uncharacterized protein n=1 Tax=Romanomermis culicivorax TaxID=13658 RepID=A0A915IGU1_ROMCU
MPNPHQTTLEQTLTILAVSGIRDHAVEHCLKEVHIPPAVQETIFTKPNQRDPSQTCSTLSTT